MNEKVGMRCKNTMLFCIEKARYRRRLQRKQIVISMLRRARKRKMNPVFDYTNKNLHLTLNTSTAMMQKRCNSPTTAFLTNRVLEPNLCNSMSNGWAQTRATCRIVKQLWVSLGRGCDGQSSLPVKLVNDFTSSNGQENLKCLDCVTIDEHVVGKETFLG